jgi:hypothetical protein
MKTENEYIKAGYRYEKTKNNAQAHKLRAWIVSEVEQNQEFKTLILRLFEQGRSEARLS